MRAPADPPVRRFINEIVLGEESDLGPPDEQGRAMYVSHFVLYCDAMREIGAAAEVPLRFVELVRRSGLTAARSAGIAPPAAARFMDSTFALIGTKQPHIVAAAFALGREDVILRMFRGLLAEMGVTESQAPAFHYYLERRIELDEGEHGPPGCVSGIKSMLIWNSGDCARPAADCPDTV